MRPRAGFYKIVPAPSRSGISPQKQKAKLTKSQTDHSSAIQQTTVCKMNTPEAVPNFEQFQDQQKVGRTNLPICYFVNLVYLLIIKSKG